jgi:NADPH:quinone reductase-like Zn-dependent oxidoreductase
MQAIQIEAFGNPAEVLKVVDIPDVGVPAEGEVVIALEASPINPYDRLDSTEGHWFSLMGMTKCRRLAGKPR